MWLSYAVATLILCSKILMQSFSFSFHRLFIFVIIVVNLFSDKKNKKNTSPGTHFDAFTVEKKEKKKTLGEALEVILSLGHILWSDIHCLLSEVCFERCRLLRRYSTYLYSHLRVPTEHFVVLHICPKHLQFISCHMRGVWRHFKGIFCKLVSVWFLIVVYCYWRRIQNVFFYISEAQ